MIASLPSRGFKLLNIYEELNALSVAPMAALPSTQSAAEASVAGDTQEQHMQATKAARGGMLQSELQSSSQAEETAAERAVTRAKLSEARMQAHTNSLSAISGVTGVRQEVYLRLPSTPVAVTGHPKRRLAQSGGNPCDSSLGESTAGRLPCWCCAGWLYCQSKCCRHLQRSSSRICRGHLTTCVNMPCVGCSRRRA